MNTQLIPFQFESHEIRVVMMDNGPWWVAADVCAALDIGNTSMALARLDDDEKSQVVDPATLNSNEGTGINSLLNVINEPGIYTLILGSRKPEAKTFKRWLTHDVLPSLRETGSYSVPHAKPAANEFPIKDAMGWFSSFSAFAKNELGLKDNFAKLSANICTYKMVGVDVLDFFGQTHLIANPKGLTYNPTELGELLNPPRSAKWVNKSVAIAGLQTNENGKWIPTEKAEGLYEWTDTGKRHHDGLPVKQLRWFKDVLDFVITSEDAAEQAQAA